MNDPTMKSLASHLRQMVSHASYAEADLFPLVQEGKHALELVERIADPILREQVRAFAKRVAGLEASELASEAITLVDKLEYAGSTPSPADPPRVVTAPPRDTVPNLGGARMSVHWQDQGETDMDGLLAATVPTTGDAARDADDRRRLERDFNPPEGVDDQ